MIKRKRAIENEKAYFDDQDFDFLDKKQAFFKLFSLQDEDTRNSILQDLPAYNAMLSLEAESFEELALQQIAKSSGEVYNKYQKIHPLCPYCGNKDGVTKKTGYTYRCSACGKSFTANHNSISSGTRCDALTWMKVLHGILHFDTIGQICDYCHIEKKTFYNLRNRLFYALQIFMDDVKLYGLIEVDNTFVKVSYKGMNLRYHDYPEDSVFEDASFLPRPARHRGGAYLQSDKNSNYICVFTAIDETGHTLARFSGIGVPSFRSLNVHVPSNKFLLIVPEIDPFHEFHRRREASQAKKPGDRSLMIADKEQAIEKFAKRLQIDFESHVYRIDGRQKKMAEGSHNVQRVNALHKRLVVFLQKTGYVSSKYLPGYLLLFEFMENTGGSPEAINKLFQILATPNLGNHPSFYQEMYTVPNYLLEWLEDDNSLKKLPYNKILAFYLYDHIRKPEEYPDTKVSIDYICKETSYSASYIRKSYRDLCDAGYRTQILQYFGEPTCVNQTASENKASPKGKTKKCKEQTTTDKIRRAAASINPTVLAIFDEYVQLRLLPPNIRPTFAQFLDEKNRQYGTNYKRTNMLAKFKVIVDLGIREPLPELDKSIPAYRNGTKERNLLILEDFESIKRSYRERGEPEPRRENILRLLSEKYGLSINTISQYITCENREKRESAKDVT